MSVVVNIDAGHGSSTAGKRTPDGYREHWANVKVANYLAKAFDRCGISYSKTGWDDDNATDDADTPLGTRQKQIKSYGAQYNISIHFNAYGTDWNNAQGIECLVSDKDSCLGDSMNMAKAIHDEIIKGTTQKDRGIKRQALSMCNCTLMGTKAATLVECGFMTNQYEAKLMKSDAFCKETAEEIAKGFCKYINRTYVAQDDDSIAEETVITKYAYYTVVKGDTLSKIAKQFGYKSYTDLAKLNGMKWPYTIKVGQKIRVK